MSSTKEHQIYDDVASDYDIIWQKPACIVILELVDQQLRTMGDLKGARVLDLACGTGLGLRMLRKLGAGELIGVDISPEMVAVGQEMEAAGQAAVPMSLHVADCSKPLDHLGLQPASFDLVMAMWLLNYAESREMIAGMWANIARYLKPGGRFMGVIQNYKHVPTSVETLKYGARVSYLAPIPDGAKLHVEFSTDPKVEFDIFVLDQPVVEEECAKAGLKDLHYVRATQDTLSESERRDLDWWRELLDEYPNQLILASKP